VIRVLSPDETFSVTARGRETSVSGAEFQMSKLQRTAFVLIVVIGGSTWLYLLGLFLPYEQHHEAAGMTWTGRFDLYPRWLGTRELILHGRNPYSAEVTRDIQMGYYGRLVDGHGFPNDEQRFAYPLYIVFLLAPTIYLPFTVVNTIFGILLFALTIASVHLWMRARSISA
jgi:hypothetical protein